MRSEDSMYMNAVRRMSRRTFLKMAGVVTSAIAFGGAFRAAFGQLPPMTDCGIQEVFPTSPFIVSPFTDDLPVPLAMPAGWKPDPTIQGAQVDWTVRRSKFLADADNLTGAGVVVPGPAEHQQDVYGHLLPGDTAVNGQGHEHTVAVEHLGTHQVWPVPLDNPPTIGGHFDRLINWPADGVEPIPYHIRMQVGPHKFTRSKVRPIDSLGNPVTPPAGANVQPDASGLYTLPDSVVYGFNGAFPGALINAEYGKPLLVRFENDLDKNPLNLDRQNFGAPDFAFLTHLHNGHTAAESDGQPHYMQINDGGYTPGDWVDNLYLAYPAGGDPAEIQTFLWFHDHRMHHTGANVYKGMVGLMPHYDPGIPANPGQPADANGNVPGTGLDTGNEADPAPNLKLPGVMVDNDGNPGRNPDGTFNVKYDIPMAIYDCALEDGVTPHADMHTPNPAVPGDTCGATHPEWWGKTFFKHFPNHGFVGDIFTVNCVAFPVLHVFKRRYRFRFLDASVARIYELALMTSAAGPVEKPGTQGQWQISDGKKWKQWTWIADMGGLQPEAQVSDTFLIWPASRLEFVVDFTDAQEGDVIYITNVLQMSDGRKPDNFNDPAVPIDTLPYKVPLVKIVVGGAPPELDQSAPIVAGTPLRPRPRLANGDPITLLTTAALPHKEFVLTRGGPGDEGQWVINGLPFEPLVPLTTVVRDHPEVWINKNGGGGWAHPMHMHQEEHTVISRINSVLPFHLEDSGKQDVTNLEPGESVEFYRNFRTFTGRYVAHCHNLAHEDHNMMFGWTIVDAPAAEGLEISGTVTDAFGRELAGVAVTLAGAASQTVMTDASGSYRFTGLADGRYRITPSLGGFRMIPRRRNVTVKGASLTARNFVGVA